MSEPVLELVEVWKAFSGTQAVRDVSLTVHAAEVVAIVGHNGSGKSTLIKIITGYHRQDRGAVHFNDQQSQRSAERPVAVMHQDLGLVDSLSVLDNLCVGRYETGIGRRIKWRFERGNAVERLEAFGCSFSPDVPVSRLLQGERAMVALLRALGDLEERGQDRGKGILLLDEPTASLAGEDANQVLRAVRELKQRGQAVVMVTHHLREVFAVADRVVVMRSGDVVLDEPVGNLTEEDVIEAMVGEAREPEPVESLGWNKDSRGAGEGAPVLEVAGLAGGSVRDVSFIVREGEIVGLAGLAGSGNTELPYLIAGGRRLARGSIRVQGEDLSVNDPAAARDRGLALVPSDRQRQSGVMSMSVAWNISLPRLKELRLYGRVDSKAERTLVERVMSAFRISPPTPDRPLSTLSGGNQQRVLVGRWLDAAPTVLLLDDPCAGVDIMSRQAIIRSLRKAAASGMAVVMASGQDDDLAEACTRVLVMSNGRISTELVGAQLTREDIGRECLAAGATRGDAAEDQYELAEK